MADKKKLSVEEVLAACRRMDAKDGGAPEPTEGSASSSEPAPEAVDAPVKEPAGERSAPSGSRPAAGQPPGEMSVAEILAAARAEKAASGGAESAGAESAAKPAAAKPSAAKPAAATPPGQMSVADILAAARGEKSKPAAEKPAAAKPAAAKPAAKAAPKEAAPKEQAKPAAAKAALPKDTASILAAARKESKPGPVTKAEAATRQADVAVKERPRPVKEAIAVPPMPAKPDYARPRPPRTEPTEAPRRNFLAALLALVLASPLAIGFSTLAVTNIMWLLGLARFMFPNILIEPPTRFKVGFPDEYGPGQVEEKYKAQFGVWVVRYEYEGQSQIYALRSVCTHLGCTPNWLDAEQKFKCPCHGSGFYKDGVNFEGPAPRPLERYAIRLADDGQLEVDKSRTFQEELGQWKDPNSYVTV